MKTKSAGVLFTCALLALPLASAWAEDNTVTYIVNTVDNGAADYYVGYSAGLRPLSFPAALEKNR
ncbi:MAG: hypothetical protein NTV49_08460 [Kiritimatiellaeota bacterium]|nr:hypothetical protein [Kiritimatiellota bacterium]